MAGTGRLPLGDPVSIQREVKTGNTFTSSSSSITRAGATGIGRGEVGWKPSVFDFKSTRSGSTCPTCKGSGRIPKGQEDELVALIPYNDKRLKPRRTCLYVSLMALLLIAAAGVLTAFLYPRSVAVFIVNINATNSTNDTTYCSNYPPNNSSYDVVLGVQTTIRIKNSNFYPVTVSTINVTLLYYENEVGWYSYPSFIVNSRSSKNVTANLTATFCPPESERLELICVEHHSWMPQIFIKAMALAQYSHLVGDTSTSLGMQGKDVTCSDARISTLAPTFAPKVT